MQTKLDQMTGSSLQASESHTTIRTEIFANIKSQMFCMKVNNMVVAVTIKTGIPTFDLAASSASYLKRSSPHERKELARSVVPTICSRVWLPNSMKSWSSCIFIRCPTNYPYYRCRSFANRSVNFLKYRDAVNEAFVSRLSRVRCIIRAVFQSMHR